MTQSNQVMKVRNAVIIDIPQLTAIEWESFTEPWTYSTLVSELENEANHFQVADIGFVVTGYCILRKNSDDCEILRMAVDRSQRRTGIADALMTSMFNYAKSEGLKNMFLEVRCSNEAAIALYEKHGFKVISTRDKYYTKPVEDAFVMACKL